MLFKSVNKLISPLTLPEKQCSLQRISYFAMLQLARSPFIYPLQLSFVWPSVLSSHFSIGVYSSTSILFVVYCRALCFCPYVFFHFSCYPPLLIPAIPIRSCSNYMFLCCLLLHAEAYKDINSTSMQRCPDLKFPRTTLQTLSTS